MMQQLPESFDLPKLMPDELASLRFGDLITIHSVINGEYSRINAVIISPMNSFTIRWVTESNERDPLNYVAISSIKKDGSFDTKNRSPFGIRGTANEWITKRVIDYTL